MADIVIRDGIRWKRKCTGNNFTFQSMPQVWRNKSAITGKNICSRYVYSLLSVLKLERKSRKPEIILYRLDGI